MPRSFREHRSQWPVMLPTGPYNGHTTCVPRELLPLIVGSLDSVAIQARYAVETDGSAELSAIRGTQYMLVQNCNNGWQQLYMLIDSIYNGQEYIHTVVDSVDVINPPIPVVPVPPRTNQMDANETLIGLVGDGILGLPVTSPYPVTESIIAVLTQIRDKEGNFTDEEKAEIISALVDNLPALLQILAAL